MTPQETQLVNDLFDRLAKLENSPRDADAERLIAEGLQRAPHAVYALVQTALLQDEALRRANARIEALQAQLGGASNTPHQGGFLDSMRDALFGHDETRGSVPTVRPQSPPQPAGGTPGMQAPPGYAQRLSPQPPAYAAPPSFGSGGSFLGTAASAAAGVIGGSLLLDGIRSMFGHHAGFYGSNPSPLGDFGRHDQPWASGVTEADLSNDDRADALDNNQNDVVPDDQGQSDLVNADYSDAPGDDSDWGGDIGGDVGGGSDSYDV